MSKRPPVKADPEQGGGILGLVYWRDIDAARREVAACHGLISRLYCALRLRGAEGTRTGSLSARVAALEAHCVALCANACSAPAPCLDMHTDDTDTEKGGAAS